MCFTEQGWLLKRPQEILAIISVWFRPVIYLNFFFFSLFQGYSMAYQTSAAYGSFQARDWIRATAARLSQPQQHQIQAVSETYATACGNAGFLTSEWGQKSSWTLCWVLNLLSPYRNSNTSYLLSDIQRVAFSFLFFFKYNDFFYYSWFIVFCQFSTVQHGDPCMSFSFLTEILNTFNIFKRFFFNYVHWVNPS